ncbi:hypothetical protein JCGZ_17349 [Jatropha curcas]|uniref:Anthocyanidin 3-O-glucosyltransferase n=2 Tax=Jatropha curcas TaxID=180498 RepID=A0A067LBJ7_JATCU|nr:hypothetical protein JCGZ_17349 [Jatropha curcas]
MVSKTQYLLSTSVYELESKVIDALKLKFPFRVLPLGPMIPYFELESNSSSATNGYHHNLPYYLQWLNSQPRDSVLYISMGSFLSVSSNQMDEIIAGVLNSGVRFLWVSRGEISLFKDGHGDMGLVVPWCDQLRVLCHPSVGGFWTHCGWNSTLEGVFAGVPMLTSPIVCDQIPNSKKIVQDWKIGWSLERGAEGKNLVKREEIAELVQRFMDQENIAVKEMRKRAKEVQESCQAAIANGGSSDTNLDSFIRDISECQAK